MPNDCSSNHSHFSRKKNHIKNINIVCPVIIGNKGMVASLNKAKYWNTKWLVLIDQRGVKWTINSIALLKLMLDELIFFQTTYVYFR